MLWETKRIGKRWAQGWHSGIVSSQNWYSKSLVKHIQKISATWMYLHLPSRLSHLPCMFNEGPNEKKNQNTFSKKFLLAQVSAFPWFGSCAPAEEGEPHYLSRHGDVSVKLKVFRLGDVSLSKGDAFATLINWRLWCWAFVGHDFSHSWWDHSKWQLVRWKCDRIVRSQKMWVAARCHSRFLFPWQFDVPRHVVEEGRASDRAETMT